MLKPKMEQASIFEIPFISGASIKIWGQGSNDFIFKIDATEAFENGEAEYQIIEGQSYEYELPQGYFLDIHELVKQSRFDSNRGRIVPNIYVGRTSIIVRNKDNQISGLLSLEVRSVKTEYRGDYRMMLEEITEKCTDLVLLHTSPVAQHLESDFDKDPKTLYQRFAFIKSVLDTEEFKDAIHKVVSTPITKWVNVEAERDIRNIKRFDNQAMRQLSGSSNRIYLPENHSLNKKGILKSVPQKINGLNKRESIDAPENKFVKYALETFLDLVGKIKILAKDKTRLHNEATLLEDQLEQILSHSIFKEISRLNTLPLNSPVLQRKEEYREILRTWLMVDLAAKLVWRGGDDVYAAGKRNVAKLYEYWLFFKLLDIVKEVFKVEAKELAQLIKLTDGDLGLQLKEGKHIAIEGVFKNEVRNLKVEFSFNRSFGGKKEYPIGGSWTKDMRPDYTLSILPEAITQEAAEKEELIVHIHFDAKYKVEKLSELFGDEKDFVEDEDRIQTALSQEKEEEAKGNFKRVDLLKMHTYKDAIRRTGGAYVLYPGKKNEPYSKNGFHEILPGLGAFAIRPDKSDDGSLELKKFLNDVVNHFLNRASQREKTAYRTYDIHKDKYDFKNKVSEPLPEAYGANRSLMPDETFVLVGTYREENLSWIHSCNLYNTRTEIDGISLDLSSDKAGARYLLLYGKDELITDKLFKLSKMGPQVYSKQNLINKGYKNPSKDFYIVYKIDGKVEQEFVNMKWNIEKLKGIAKQGKSMLPFSVSLSNLMNAIIKNEW